MQQNKSNFSEISINMCVCVCKLYYLLILIINKNNLALVDDF